MKIQTFCDGSVRMFKKMGVKLNGEGNKDGGNKKCTLKSAWKAS
jgi:hypothetical protein